MIAGPVEYVLKNKTLPDDVREQLHVVERNTDRMLRLVNQILDFRKIQKNKMKLRIEQIDIVPFVRHIMDNFESLAEEHHIDFVFESEMPSLKLWVDADKLEKIVFNLLSNAFKYTPQGKMITLFIHENEHNVAIGVQDQGIGISESKKASLLSVLKICWTRICLISKAQASVFLWLRNWWNCTKRLSVWIVKRGGQLFHG